MFGLTGEPTAPFVPHCPAVDVDTSRARRSRRVHAARCLSPVGRCLELELAATSPRSRPIPSIGLSVAIVVARSVSARSITAPMASTGVIARARGRVVVP